MRLAKSLLAIALAGSAQPVAFAQPASSTQPMPDRPARRPEEAQASPMRAYDIDKDGTLDLAEVKSAAAARFDELNPDGDDKLDPKEAAPALPADAFRQADTDGDGTVDKAEYLAYVERMFLRANPDKDGSLDRKELGTAAGQRLMHLLR